MRESGIGNELKPLAAFTIRSEVSPDGVELRDESGTMSSYRLLKQLLTEDWQSGPGCMTYIEKATWAIDSETFRLL